MIKLCINCVHYRKIETVFAQCNRTEHTEPVHGETKYTYCSIERLAHVGCCGPEARFFEQSTQKAAIEIA